MSSLRERQRDFAGAITGDAAAWAHPGCSVYAGNVLGNWRGALAGAYPIVRKILGEGYFDGLARAYATTHSSRSGDLNEYGSDFPDFLDACADVADVPYLPDVARMEWLVHLAYYAADGEAFDPAKLAAIPPDRHAGLRLRLAPGAALFASRWPLDRLWIVHQDGYIGPFDVDFGGPEVLIAVFRPEWHAEVEPLPRGDGAFLARAVDGATLGEALEAGCAADASFDPAQALARWIRKGVVNL